MTTKLKHAACQYAIGIMVAFLPAIAGCGSHGDLKGSLVSADIPLAAYVKMNLNASNDKGRFFFPQLQIYDGSGNLVYASHESIENVNILREIPTGVQGLPVKPNAAHLSEIMDEVPAFRQVKTEILDQHGISVLSIFLQDCEACTVQEDALSDTERRLQHSGINVLVLNLSRPKT